MAPEAGLEPATSKLTASCSTIELLRNTALDYSLVLRLKQAYGTWYGRTRVKLFLLTLLYSCMQQKLVV